MLPNKINALKQQLITLLKQGHIPQAKQVAQKILQHSAGDVGIWFILGQINDNLALPSEAMSAYSKASTSKSPHQIQALDRLTYLCLDNRLYGEALSAADRWRELEPNNATALQRKGFALCQLKQSEYGLKLIREAHEQAPEDKDIHICFGETMLASSYINKSIQVYQKDSFYKSSVKAHARYVEAHNYSDQYSAEQLFTCAQEFGKDIEAQTQQLKLKVPPYNKERRIRLAYLSPDFRTHSVAHFMKPIYEGHDSKKFEIFSYYDGNTVDKTMQFFKAKSEHWLETRNLSDEALAQKIVDDRIDILVDLAGHTATKPRAHVFAAKPAPIQVNYLGYPNTSGLSRMTHRFVDNYTDPENESERFCSEDIVRLPNGFLCFKPEHQEIAAAELPAKENNYLTYGSLNSGLKITDSMLSLWAKIQEIDKTSRLIIKNNCMHDQSATKVFKDRCSRAGIDLARVEFLAFIKSQKTHLELYHRIDIHLDTHPYSGTTTTFEALWMGVPTVTLVGNTHRSRVSGSILSRLGLKDFIATNETDYIDKCTNWRLKIDGLSELRKNLRSVLESSEMMNAKLFTQTLEAAYEGLITKL